MNTRRMTSILAGGALALTASACATETTTSESGANLISEGTLTVCTSLPYEPFEFRQGNEVVGFDMAMMDAIAEANGLEKSVEVTGFDGIQSGQALNSGLCDVAAAGMTITDARAEAIDFSDPYFNATQALLTTDESITSLEDLSGMSLGVMTGTTGEIYAEENAPEDVEIRSFEDLGLQTQAVSNGQVDAIIQDNGPLLDYANKNEGTFVTAEFETGEEYGFAVRKDGNDELLASINEVIATVQEDGTYDEIYTEWFGQAPESE
ncbi:basic amino acid ABC transporter substrate-binding protein [Phycicoccus sp. BSK3Z-2]|uniref:Basic amino acid ABC transporter substrate-binding protein n=1 Tax=Phycicoccus avicenniae TaxID=2828860 RepID=A0A941HXY2_9MICO|nr:basic amino acid ABC transporter substrate-binding protein [Phycicoccus avicenniae]MBR7742343.1 basic amino acid ABC transporter substrate-binding protein [Phycicoccus avicenniae]